MHVSLWEASDALGGVATSAKLPSGQWINNQVQGGADSYHNTLEWLKTFGITPRPVSLKICFGSGDRQWSNFAPPSGLMKSLAPEIARLGRELRAVSRIAGMLTTISEFLRKRGFPESMRTHVVVPLVSLFLGTGDQAANVPVFIVSQLFFHPELRLFPFSDRRLVEDSPAMFAFPNLQRMYADIATQSLQDVDVRLGCRVTRVVRTRDKVVVFNSQGTRGTFDKIVFACPADAALRALKAPTWLERLLLPRVQYYEDLAVTHTDRKYLSALFGKTDTVKGANYFVHVRSSDAGAEMSFNLGAYQPGARGVFQTYFLDAGKEAAWTEGDLRPDKVCLRQWLRQFAHNRRHFLSWVPFSRLIQNSMGNTWYCGSHLLFNTHEMAILSGIAVATELGAEYPFPHHSKALALFNLFASAVGCGRVPRR